MSIVGTLVTAHEGRWTYEGRVTRECADGGLIIDRQGMLRPPVNAQLRYVKVSTFAVVHPCVVRPRPCCVAARERAS